MNIQVIRVKQGTDSTLSSLIVEKIQRGFILEDTDRGLTATMPLAEIKQKKVYGRTAIPTGRYELVMSKSKRFGIVLPELLNVPGYEGIRMHKGNYVVNTDGCLLPGTYFDKDKNGFYRVWESGKALDSLLVDIRAAVLRKEQIWVDIIRSYPTV